MLRDSFLEAKRVQKTMYQTKNESGRRAVPLEQGERPL